MTKKTTRKVEVRPPAKVAEVAAALAAHEERRAGRIASEAEEQKRRESRARVCRILEARITGAAATLRGAAHALHGGLSVEMETKLLAVDSMLTGMAKSVADEAEALDPMVEVQARFRMAR